jgi:hypothetical protein
MIFDLATRVLFPSNGSGLESGLTFHPAPSPTPPMPSPCPNYNYAPVLRGPASTGNPRFGIDLVGLPPGNVVIYMFDFALNPAFPRINQFGCPLGVNLGAPSMFSLFGTANAAGTASLPLPLMGIPPGFLIYAQYATVCRADKAGFVLTPLYQIAVSAP